MKYLRMIAMFISFLVITLPITTADLIEVPKDQLNNVGAEIDRRFTENPTPEDIVGEDIILNIDHYQPDVIRSGLIEGSNVEVLAVLTGEPTNPTIELDKIKDVHIISQTATTYPEGMPVKLGRVTHFMPPNQDISYSNMGFLRVPIYRIPKEADVPDKIQINLDTRVVFDVSSGLAASPRKMILPTMDYNEWENSRELYQYSDVFIQAEEIKNSYAIFNVYDSSLSEISKGIKVSQGQTSGNIRKDQYYIPGSVFDKFNIKVTSIKNVGKKVDLIISKLGEVQHHQVSENEKIYPGSAIILNNIEEKINEKGKKYIEIAITAPQKKMGVLRFPIATTDQKKGIQISVDQKVDIKFTEVNDQLATTDVGVGSGRGFESKTPTSIEGVTITKISPNGRDFTWEKDGITGKSTVSNILRFTEWKEGNKEKQAPFCTYSGSETRLDVALTTFNAATETEFWGMDWWRIDPELSKYKEVYKQIEECYNTLKPQEVTEKWASELRTFFSTRSKKLDEKYEEASSQKNQVKEVRDEFYLLWRTFESTYTQYFFDQRDEKILITPDDPNQAYTNAADFYGQVVDGFEGQNLVVNERNTTIGNFVAQFNKAEVYNALLRDEKKALDAYKELLSMYESYDTDKRSEAHKLTGMSRPLIESIINSLEYMIYHPSENMQGSVTLYEKNGEPITITVAGSSLADINWEEKKSYAYIKVDGGESLIVREGEPLDEEYNQIIVQDIKEDRIILKNLVPHEKGQYAQLYLKQGKTESFPLVDKGTIKVTLEKTVLNKEVHIIVSPNIETAYSGAKLSLHLPIEKRAFDLPLFSDSIEEEIEKTDKLIEKLDGLIEKVGKVHNAWMKLCMVTFATIWAWDFVQGAFGGVSGRAKQKTSELFREQHGDKCRDKRLTIDECVFEFEDEYNQIYGAAKNAYNYADSETYTGELASIPITDDNKAEMQELALYQSLSEQNAGDKTFKKEYLTRYHNFQYSQAYDKIEKELTSSKMNPLDYQFQVIQQLKVDQEMNSVRDQMHGTYSDPDSKGIIDSIWSSQSSIASTDENMVYTGSLLSQGQVRSHLGTAYWEELKNNAKEKARPQIEARLRQEHKGDSDWDDDKIKEVAAEEINSNLDGANFVYTSPLNPNPIFFNKNEIPKPAEGEKITAPKSVLAANGITYTLTDNQKPFTKKHDAFMSAYDDGPNSGKLHYMTIDAYHYIENEYSTGGRLKNTYVWERHNPNAKIRGDGSEMRLGTIENVMSYQKSNNKDLHKTLSKAKGCVGALNSVLSKGRTTGLNCELGNYGVESEPYELTQSCVDYYSPTSCKLLFNACDPVLCPASRCDLGGAWRVKDDNVIQTGIIGSSILCLSNFALTKESGGVLMPICITGIYAGLQNIQTILMEYRDCLNAAATDGISIGICDQIRSYYICDLLWKEAIAVFNIKKGLFRSAIEKMTGVAKGGGEYGDFDASMDQAVGGMKFFTQQYAKNVFAQFSGGSLPEMGAEICKSAIFGKVPGMGTFTDRIMQPESPPQFTALMDKVPYTDITPIPEAEYQIYFRIYAGANEEITYSVYLKAENLQGQQALPTYVVQSNKRLPAGAFDVSTPETAHFKTYDGYSQICVSYRSQTYGTREECGFGKTSSSFGLEYLSNKMAEMDAKNNDIQTADECRPSASNFAQPSQGLSFGNVGRVAAGGFSSGLLETGIIRVCSGVPPGEVEDWMIVGECWEEGPSKGKNLGYCWMHKPSAESVVKEYAKNPDAAVTSLYGEHLGVQQKTLEDMNKHLGKYDFGVDVLSVESMNSIMKIADEKVEQAKNYLSTDKDSAKVYFGEAMVLYTRLLTGIVFESSKLLEVKFKIGKAYADWGRALQGKLVTEKELSEGPTLKEMASEIPTKYTEFIYTKGQCSEKCPEGCLFIDSLELCKGDQFEFYTESAGAMEQKTRKFKVFEGDCEIHEMENDFTEIRRMSLLGLELASRYVNELAPIKELIYYDVIPKVSKKTKRMEIEDPYHVEINYIPGPSEKTPCPKPTSFPGVVEETDFTSKYIYYDGTTYPGLVKGKNSGIYAIIEPVNPKDTELTSLEWIDEKWTKTTSSAQSPEFKEISFKEDVFFEGSLMEDIPLEKIESNGRIYNLVHVPYNNRFVYHEREWKLVIEETDTTVPSSSEPIDTSKSNELIKKFVDDLIELYEQFTPTTKASDNSGSGRRLKETIEQAHTDDIIKHPLRLRWVNKPLLGNAKTLKEILTEASEVDDWKHLDLKILEKMAEIDNEKRAVASTISKRKHIPSAAELEVGYSSIQYFEKRLIVYEYLQGDFRDQKYKAIPQDWIVIDFDINNPGKNAYALNWDNHLMWHDSSEKTYLTYSRKKWQDVQEDITRIKSMSKTSRSDGEKWKLEVYEELLDEKKQRQDVYNKGQYIEGSYIDMSKKGTSCDEDKDCLSKCVDATRVNVGDCETVEDQKGDGEINFREPYCSYWEYPCQSNEQCSIFNGDSTNKYGACRSNSIDCNSDIVIYDAAGGVFAHRKIDKIYNKEFNVNTRLPVLNDREFIQTLIKINNECEDEVTNLIIQAHGSAQGIFLQGNLALTENWCNDNEGMLKDLDLFKDDNSEMVFASCKAGQAEPFLQCIADKLDVKTTASKCTVLNCVGGICKPETILGDPIISFSPA
jgi:hypothetical protein